jgi:glycosyltransferase involved in cell wall biosynthesis
MGDSVTIKVSAVLSIHNRSKLFRRALDGYMTQTMPPEEWEIVLVDDRSTEDLSETYRHLTGKINLRHVYMDPTDHPKFKGFHTPALSINLGTSLARGNVICLCHPEILHAPTNFERACARLPKENAFLFGTAHLGTAKINAALDADPDWTRFGWKEWLWMIGGRQLERFAEEMYWYCSFLPKAAVEKVGGVDFEYLGGIAGEDDDFRWRVWKSGCTAVFAPEIEGLHQDHSTDKDSWTMREVTEREAALNRNRALLYARLGQPNPAFGPAPCGPGFPQPANQGMDWTAKDCLKAIREYTIS